VLSTGRGLLVVWLYDLVPAAALPRWKAMQRHLAEKLRLLGADFGALDAARVFRVVGTRNGKSGTLVRSTYVNDTSGGILRWDFDDLALEVLPFTRQEIWEKRARRAERALEKPGPGPVRAQSGTTYWETVLADLHRLGQIRWSDHLPPGHRDHWLFVACVALSWTVAPGRLRPEFRALALNVAGWGEGECNRRMTTVFDRLDAVLAGRKVEWRGRQVAPRYRMKASTIIDRLGITEAEMRSAGLRVLVTQVVAKDRAAERQRACRRRSGIIPRAEYELAAATRQEEAARLRSSGLSWRDVASALGLPSSDAARMSASRVRPKPKANGSITVHGGETQVCSLIVSLVSSVPEGDPNAVDPDSDPVDRCPTDSYTSAESRVVDRSEEKPTVERLCVRLILPPPEKLIRRSVETRLITAGPLLVMVDLIALLAGLALVRMPVHCVSVRQAQGTRRWTCNHRTVTISVSTHRSPRS
jgi:hypothetical protein